MKNKYIKSSVLAAITLSFLASCDYLKCAMSDSPQECMIGRTIERATQKIDESMMTVSTEAEAENIADNMDTLLTAIETAQTLKIDIPDSAKESYNNALRTMVKKNYYNSEKVHTALKNARPL